MGGGKD
jgi:hypothetical protein